MQFDIPLGEKSRLKKRGLLVATAVERIATKSRLPGDVEATPVTPPRGQTGQDECAGISRDIVQEESQPSGH